MTDIGAGVDHAEGESSVAAWPSHLVRAGSHSWEGDEPPVDVESQRKRIEPWIAALLQAEHVGLLLGSGFTNAVASSVGAKSTGMDPVDFDCRLSSAVDAAATTEAGRIGRGAANFEDQIRAALDLVGGLRILEQAQGDSVFQGEDASQLLAVWEQVLDSRLGAFLKGVLQSERGISDGLSEDTEAAARGRRLLASFLMTFASRTATRDRLHVFTTNYDRLVEFGCEMLGLRVLDRFVGQLSPVFRASRLGIDLHYNPPGIRGEPRYLEGVVRLTKLHGSVDWRQETDVAGVSQIRRTSLPFAAAEDHPDLPTRPLDSAIIYPNPAKDVETLQYPYAELFRDFAAATCRPNSVLVTYGYGFGDDHANRVLRDMLTIPSAHLAVVAYGDPGGRIRGFCNQAGRPEQVTLLMGPHFADLGNLVEDYLPKSAIDRTTMRMAELVNRRTVRFDPDGPGPEPSDSADGFKP